MRASGSAWAGEGQVESAAPRVWLDGVQTQHVRAHLRRRLVVMGARIRFLGGPAGSRNLPPRAIATCGMTEEDAELGSWRLSTVRFLH